jgi:hypothetical protein
MDKAEQLLNQGLYEQSIDLYFQAELVLSEINYPTKAIKEMIQKIEEKKREEDLSKQYELEQMIRKQEEEKLFQTKIAEGIILEQQRMKDKQISLMQQSELKNYMEQRKQDAFELLDNADLFINKSEYDKALDYYRSAELILNEIQFPTSSLKELILKVQEKKREKEFEKQKAIELKIKEEQEALKFQSIIAENLRREKARLQAKEIEIARLDELKTKLDQKREKAFKKLDEAEIALKNTNYDKSIALYRKSMMILNEIQFPTDSINATILKIMNLKKQKALEEETKLKIEIEKIEEEKNLAALFEERKRKEKEAKIVKELALKQREKLVQEQMTHREVAYSFLEEAGKYLKKRIPDYESAISLYIQARDLLAEKIGWEPEIKNLNVLISDLQKEKEKLIEKQKVEKEISLKRQREYKLFQEEIQKRKEIFEKKKREQEHKLKELQRVQQQTEIIKEEGFSLIDKGKKFAAYHNFDYAYDAFKEAIYKFNQIGWQEQTKYIQKEIENTKNLQKKVEKEELEVRKIYENLEKKKITDELKSKEKEKEIKKTITEVGSLTDEISKLINIKIKQIEIEEREKKERIRNEAKDFRENLGDLIKLKQELTTELTKSKKESEKELEKEKIKKDKEKADEIKEMLKNIAKKDKK